jgi:hypothetical protein
VLTVATAIFGPGYKLHEAQVTPPHCRFICFTDQELTSETWEIVRQSHALPPRRANRHVKALLHRYVSGRTLYIDSEFEVTGDPLEVVGDALDGACWAATRHPIRDCLFAEAEFCITTLVTPAGDLRAQIARYRAAGMPRHFGLWAGGIIARRGDKDSAALGEAWWTEIVHGAERDQVSLPFVARTLGLMPATIPGVYTVLPGLARRKR